jgi:hypothetical protein
MDNFRIVPQLHSVNDMYMQYMLTFPLIQLLVIEIHKYVYSLVTWINKLTHYLNNEPFRKAKCRRCSSILLHVSNISEQTVSFLLCHRI